MVLAKPATAPADAIPSRSGSWNMLAPACAYCREDVCGAATTLVRTRVERCAYEGDCGERPRAAGSQLKLK